MVPFSGWEMPVQYRGIGQEHLAVRSGVGIFDVSHMGQLHIAGHGCVDFLKYLLPVDVGRIRAGAMKYAVMCNEHGGAVDDLAVYRHGEREFLLVVNAGRIDADLEWIRVVARGTETVVEDRSAATGNGRHPGSRSGRCSRRSRRPRSSGAGLFPLRILLPFAERISLSAVAGTLEKTALKSCALLP